MVFISFPLEVIHASVLLKTNKKGIYDKFDSCTLVVSHKSGNRCLKFIRY